MKTFVVALGIMGLILIAVLGSAPNAQPGAQGIVSEGQVGVTSHGSSPEPFTVNIHLNLVRPPSLQAAQQPDSADMPEAMPPEAAQPPQTVDSGPALALPPAAPSVSETGSHTFEGEQPAPIVWSEPSVALPTPSPNRCGCSYRGECLQARSVPSTQVVRTVSTKRVRRCGLFRRLGLFRR